MSKRFLLAGFVLMAAARPAQAQIPGIDVSVAARVGYFTPLGTLAESSTGELKLSSGLSVGGHIELDIPLSPINIRANAEATFGRSVELDGEEIPASDLDIVALTGDLVFRPLPRIVVLQPYLLAGAGIKRYSGAGDDQSKFTGHVGAGADLKFGPIGLLAEINDYISSFKDTTTGDSKLQNDIFVSLGFRIGLL